ncbi:MAG: metal-dependent hydrolase [Nanoarchaeota archaeon]
MPTAVFHILVPLFLVGIFRHFYLKKRKTKYFPKDYILLAGIAGIIPDLDFIFVWIGSLFVSNSEIFHGTITHSFFVLPLIFLLAGIFTRKDFKLKIKNHKINLSHLFFILAFGAFIHVFLDFIFDIGKPVLYPLLKTNIGLGVIYLFNENLQPLILPTIEGILLVIWLVYLYLKNKIRNFV